MWGKNEKSVVEHRNFIRSNKGQYFSVWPDREKFTWSVWERFNLRVAVREGEAPAEPKTTLQFSAQEVLRPSRHVPKCGFVVNRADDALERVRCSELDAV